MEKLIHIVHSKCWPAVQKLISLDKVVAGIYIYYVLSNGVFSLKWSFFKVNFPTINPLKGTSVCLPYVNWVHYAFCNTMKVEQTTKVFNDFVVPESRNIPGNATEKDVYIEFKKLHQPLLFIVSKKTILFLHH